MDGEGAVVKSYDYDEFGVTTSTGDAFFNEVTFTGSVADASGLLYMNARYYNPPPPVSCRRIPTPAPPSTPGRSISTPTATTTPSTWSIRWGIPPGWSLY